MEEDLLKMIHIRPIEAADDPHMARLVRESLRRHGLDIPGTAYFDPELDHLSVHYALRPDRRAYFIAEGPAGRVLGGAGIGELGGYPDCAELQKIYVAPDAQRRGHPHVRGAGIPPSGAFPLLPPRRDGSFLYQRTLNRACPCFFMLPVVLTVII